MKAKNPHAVAIGKLGGRKGGLQRAKNLSKAERSKQARHAARCRWDAVFAQQAKALAHAIRKEQNR